MHDYQIKRGNKVLLRTNTLFGLLIGMVSHDDKAASVAKEKNYEMTSIALRYTFALLRSIDELQHKGYPIESQFETKDKVMPNKITYQVNDAKYKSMYFWRNGKLYLSNGVTYFKCSPKGTAQTEVIVYKNLTPDPFVTLFHELGHIHEYYFVPPNDRSTGLPLPLSEAYADDFAERILKITLAPHERSVKR